MPSNRSNSVLFFLALAGAVVTALLILWWVDPGQRAPDLQRLVGRWERTDGPYALEVRQVGTDGKVEAAYFNPKPIKVAEAQARIEEGIPRLVVELRDINYPGSTYTLTYNGANDELLGVYFQAKDQIFGEVTFTRK